MDSLTNDVLQIFADVLDVPEENLTVETAFSDLDVSELDKMALIMECEDFFKVDFPDQEIENLNRLQDVINVIKNKS